MANEVGFQPEVLRRLRLQKQLSAASVSRRLGISSAQVHRLENGQRRLTVDAFIDYCRAIDVAPARLLTQNTWVPITGVIDSEFQINPVPPNAEDKVLAPPLADDMSNLAGVQWAPSRRFAPMRGHVAFYGRHEQGVPDIAWGKRCVVMRADSSQCLGWIVKQGDNVHIDSGDGPVEFDVAVTWASPILCVMAPWAMPGVLAPGQG